MNKLDTYIPPNSNLITRSLSGSHPISKRFTPNRRFSADELPTWVEQSQDHPVQEKHQGLWFKISPEKLSPKIGILIHSPIPTLTKLDNA